MDNLQWDRLAECYHEEIVSPFYGNVKNPLVDELDNIKGKKAKSIAEFGCGHFNLGKELCSSFRSVHASDFSEKMIEIAATQNKFSNLILKVEDIRTISYKSKFDVIISVNSILMPSFKDNLKSFCNLFEALKDGGTLLLIVPSMESILYHGMLLLHSELLEKDIRKARISAKRKFEHGKYDFFLGHYIDDDERQKFYYEHEIRYMLKKAGFTNLSISKVNYPWGEDVSDYDDFPEEEPLWDWFIKAT